MFNEYKQPWQHNNYRIYLPLVDNGSKKEVQPPPDISNALSGIGYTITDYSKGLASKDNKNQTNIGKILAKLGDNELKKKFDNDPTRTGINNQNLMVCISRHPVDIAGMSTDRGWVSCMTIKNKEQKKGENARYVNYDVKEGTLIAYLIREDDKNIKNPIARVLIKPYQSQDKESIYLKVSKKIYGNAGIYGDKFIKTINDWLFKTQKEVNGVFISNPKLYKDSGDITKIVMDNGKDVTVLKTKVILDGRTYTLEQLYEMKDIEVEGDVNLISMDITKLPHFKRVGGNFICRDNQLTSLYGCPTYVGGRFDCRENRLTSLNGCPTEVGGDFLCWHNQLTSLKGCPTKVSGDFYCHYNQLTSLEYCPNYVGGDFVCGHNKVKLSRPEGVEIVGEFIN